jgi:uncharacterized ferritin-like protein (DUF455 family)
MAMPNFSPRMGGRMSLAEKKRRLLRFHWVEMEILEILSSWSETMVYIPVRAGVGRQMWEQALHCDGLGWALRNLRHLGRVIASRAPTDEFARYCEQLHRTEDPTQRLVGLHRVLIPALAAAERTYLDATDRLGDGNSVDALELCLRNHEAQQLWAEQMLAGLLTTQTSVRQAAEFEYGQRLALISAGGIDADGPLAYFLPYHGWPEHDEAAAARAELPTALGQWQTTGYAYDKTFERGVTRLRWDDRFHYAESPTELDATSSPGTVDSLVRWLHDLFHGECQTVDRMGWLLVDFPDLPWAMRKDMAQQAWEEARHMQLDAQLIEGLGARLGEYPFPPYFGHLRRDHHHPVAHMIMGNIMGEGSAAASTNDALRFTKSWGNEWLRQGLEHLSGDEVVHINFGKNWARQLSREDRTRYWEEGKTCALAAQNAIEEHQRAFGLEPDGIARVARIEREFTALLSEADEATSAEAS